jgi:histidinol-phosphate aminotransferase
MWDIKVLQAICARFNGLVVIDEAYAAFASRTHTNLLAPNVMVLRTFSKLGWAGLRLGYLLGDASFIGQLNKVRMPYNINSLTQASARFLLPHNDLFQAQARTICRERKRLADALEQLNKIHVFPSETNFLLVRLTNSTAVFEGLKKHKILVKNMHGSDDSLKHCLRITIGTEAENNQLLAAMKVLTA